MALEATLVDDSGAGAPVSPLLATTTMRQESGGLAVATGGSAKKLAAFSPGYVLADRYRIVERIGKGGFGFVYAAEDLELEVTVAIKILRPEVDGKTEMIRRFKQEIQLARQVTHENVCRIYDVGFYTFGDLRAPFLSMELLEGESLSQRLDRMGTLPWREIRHIALQVADGLQAAHRVGVVHADLKPANVMLVGEGMSTRAVVTDFGLASAYAADAETSQGTIVGTPAYMAPEQVRGDTLGPAADFYALGCTLFHVITGRIPFREDSALATAEARLSGKIPRLSSLEKPVPANWSSVVKELMSLTPGKRIVSAAELRRRLRPSRPRWALPAALATLVLVALTVAFLAWPAKEAPSEIVSEPVFVLSLPEPGEARERYEEGLRLWENSESQAALDVWEKAVADGLGHPLTHHRICSAYSFFNRIDDIMDCRLKAYKGAQGLSRDEEDYYKALYHRQKEEHVRSVRMLLNLLDRYPGEYEFVIAIVGTLRTQREFADAREMLSRAIPKNELQRVSLAAYEVGILAQEKRYGKILNVAAEPLASARKLGFARQELSLLEDLAQANRNLGNLKESRENGERGLALAQEIGSTRDEAQAVSLLAAVAMREHRYADAEKYVEMRTRFLRQLGNEVAANQMLITKSEIYLVTGRPREADEILTREALPRLRSTDNTYWEGYALISRAEVRRSLGRAEEAIEDCSAGEAIFRGIRSRRLQAFAKMVCGHAFLDAGRLDEAERDLEEAYNMRAELKLDLLLLQNRLSKAEVSLARGRADEAYTMAADVAALYADKNLEPDEKSARELMARAALRAGNDAGAAAALAPLKEMFRGEHAEINLQIDILRARLAAREEPTASHREALERLLKQAEELGYLRVAQTTRVALEQEQAK